MNRFLIVYSSKYGQTAKISHYIESRLCNYGYVGHTCNILDEDPHPSKYDTVIVGAPVYAGKFPIELLAWTKRNAALLSRRQNAFFSDSLNAADSRTKARIDDVRLLNKFKSKTNWNPNFEISVAGALKYKSYNWLIRLVMKNISKSAGGPTDTSTDHELTNWGAVDSFLKALEENDQQSPFAVEAANPEVNQT